MAAAENSTSTTTSYTTSSPVAPQMEPSTGSTALPEALFPGAPDVRYQALVQRLLDHLTSSGLITDRSPGGVARTLTETFARELALFYQILGQAHQAGYLETARDVALEQVVALLGISRLKAGRLRGRVLFSRTSAAAQDIIIPAGLRVAGKAISPGSPIPLLEVVAETTLERGSRSVTAEVQEIPGEETPGLALIPPNNIQLMPRPLLGIDRVSNPDPITRVGQNEDDASLRARARVALRAGEQATAEALEAAVRSQGIQAVTILEPQDGPPGRVIVRIGDTNVIQSPERWAAMEAAVYRAKAAGVRILFEKIRTVIVQPSLEVIPSDPALSVYDEASLRSAVVRALGAVIGAVPQGGVLSRRKLEGAVLALPDVQEVRLLSTTRTFVLDWQEGKAKAGPADTAQRLLPDGTGWQLQALERSQLEPTDWPPDITVLREAP